ncbi:MAG: hypothetical protein KKG59_01425 [Nanoarchaeota archaeon]|nr:hypothetical protein [Nanoarchaeota archaeon]
MSKAAERAKRREERRFREKVRNDPLLVAMEDAVKRGMKYVSDTSAERKLKSRRRAVHIAMTHVSSKSFYYVANYGMLTERNERGTSISRDPEGALLVEAHVGQRRVRKDVDCAGRYYAINPRVPTVDQVKTRAQKESLERILEVTTSKALLKAGRNYLDRMRATDLRPARAQTEENADQPDDLELEMITLKATPPSRHIAPEMGTAGLNTDPVFSYIKEASSILSNLSFNGHTIQVEDPQVTYYFQEDTRRYVNSEASIIRDVHKYYGVAFSVTVIDDNLKKVPVSDGFWVADMSQITRERVVQMAEKLRKIAIKQYSAPVLRDDSYPTLGAHDFMGAHWHELVGHSIETRTINGGWNSKGYQNWGHLIAPKQLSIDMVAERNDSNGFPLLGSRRFDQEGVERFTVDGEKVNSVPVIKDGKLVNYFSDRQGAWLADYLIRQINPEANPNITPGNAFVDLSSEVDLVYDEDRDKFIPQYLTPGPRQPILDINWKFKNRLKGEERTEYRRQRNEGMKPNRDNLFSEKDAFEYFKEYLRRKGKPEGVYIESGPSGETLKVGDAVVYCVQGFLVTPDSETLRENPRKMFFTKGGSMGSFKGIHTVYGEKKAIGMVCDDSESGEFPTTVLTPGAIIESLDFKSLSQDVAASYLKLKPKE